MARARTRTLSQRGLEIMWCNPVCNHHHYHHHLCHHIALDFTVHTWWYLILDARCYFLPTPFSSFLRSLHEILWQNTHLSAQTRITHPQLHPLKSPFSASCIWSPDRELHVLRCPLCHVILSSSLNQDWSSAIKLCPLSVASALAALNSLLGCVLLLIQRIRLEGVCWLNGDITLSELKQNIIKLL